MKPVKTKDKLDKRQKQYLKKRFNISTYKDLNSTILKDLKEKMKSLTDSRQQIKCTYKIWDVVVCVIISVLCGFMSLT
jgi:flagellar motility protein MotE (MotC chaperone)